jgi:D-alanyl-D-alanine carboxypeptidase
MAVQKHGGARSRAIRAAAWLGGALAAALALAPLDRAIAADEKHAVLIVDANTGQTLYQSSADALRHPASLSKMMTLYLVFEQIEQGRLSYQTKIKASANATAAAPSKLDLEDGEEIAVIDAIKALITKSANDVAIALAEHIAGSEQKFAALMTRKAAQLGMASTRFKNASGLPDDEQVTTARDMVTLALRLQDDFPKHYPLFATRSFTYKDEIFRNHNKLLVDYEGTDGLKTGYIAASGFNLVTSVHRGQKHIVGAVFGGETAGQRDRTMRTFLNIGLVKASNVKTRPPSPTLVVARAKPSTEQRVAKVPEPIRVARPATKTPPDRIEAVLEATETAQTQFTPRWATASTETGSLKTFMPSERPALFAVGRGALPSTLDDQAARLGRNELAKTVASQTADEGPAKLRVPEPNQVRAGVIGGFHIQIGAYQSVAEALRRLAAVRDLAPGVLGSYEPVTMQFKQGTLTLHRARFAGFDAPAAANTCNELKRLKVDCLVVKAE